MSENTFSINDVLELIEKDLLSRFFSTAEYGAEIIAEELCRGVGPKEIMPNNSVIWCPLMPNVIDDTSVGTFACGLAFFPSEKYGCMHQVMIGNIIPGFIPADPWIFAGLTNLFNPNFQLFQKLFPEESVGFRIAKSMATDTRDDLLDLICTIRTETDAKLRKELTGSSEPISKEETPSAGQLIFSAGESLKSAMSDANKPRKVLRLIKKAEEVLTETTTPDTTSQVYDDLVSFGFVTEEMKKLMLTNRQENAKLAEFLKIDDSGILDVIAFFVICAYLEYNTGRLGIRNQQWLTNEFFDLGHNFYDKYRELGGSLLVDRLVEMHRIICHNIEELNEFLPKDRPLELKTIPKFGYGNIQQIPIVTWWIYAISTVWGRNDSTKFATVKTLESHFFGEHFVEDTDYDKARIERCFGRMLSCGTVKELIDEIRRTEQYLLETRKVDIGEKWNIPNLYIAPGLMSLSLHEEIWDSKILPVVLRAYIIAISCTIDMNTKVRVFSRTVRDLIDGKDNTSEDFDRLIGFFNDPSSNIIEIGEIGISLESLICCQQFITEDVTEYLYNVSKVNSVVSSTNKRRYLWAQIMTALLKIDKYPASARAFDYHSTDKRVFTDLFLAELEDLEKAEAEGTLSTDVSEDTILDAIIEMILEFQMGKIRERRNVVETFIIPIIHTGATLVADLAPEEILPASDVLSTDPSKEEIEARRESYREDAIERFRSKGYLDLADFVNSTVFDVREMHRDIGFYPPNHHLREIGYLIYAWKYNPPQEKVEYIRLVTRTMKFLDDLTITEEFFSYLFDNATTQFVIRQEELYRHLGIYVDLVGPNPADRLTSFSKTTHKHRFMLAMIHLMVEAASNSNDPALSGYHQKVTAWLKSCISSIPECSTCSLWVTGCRWWFHHIVDDYVLGSYNSVMLRGSDPNFEIYLGTRGEYAEERDRMTRAVKQIPSAYTALHRANFVLKADLSIMYGIIRDKSENFERSDLDYIALLLYSGTSFGDLRLLVFDIMTYLHEEGHSLDEGFLGQTYAKLVHTVFRDMSNSHYFGSDKMHEFFHDDTRKTSPDEKYFIAMFCLIAKLVRQHSDDETFYWVKTWIDEAFEQIEAEFILDWWDAQKNKLMAHLSKSSEVGLPESVEESKEEAASTMEVEIPTTETTYTWEPLGRNYPGTQEHYSGDLNQDEIPEPMEGQENLTMGTDDDGTLIREYTFPDAQVLPKDIREVVESERVSIKEEDRKLQPALTTPGMEETFLTGLAEKGVKLNPTPVRFSGIGIAITQFSIQYPSIARDLEDLKRSIGRKFDDPEVYRYVSLRCVRHYFPQLDYLMYLHIAGKRSTVSQTGTSLMAFYDIVTMEEFEKLDGSISAGKLVGLIDAVWPEISTRVPEYFGNREYSAYEKYLLCAIALFEANARGCTEFSVTTGEWFTRCVQTIKDYPVKIWFLSCMLSFMEIFIPEETTNGFFEIRNLLKKFVESKKIQEPHIIAEDVSTKEQEPEVVTTASDVDLDAIANAVEELQEAEKADNPLSNIEINSESDGWTHIQKYYETNPDGTLAKFFALCNIKVKTMQKDGTSRGCQAAVLSALRPLGISTVKALLDITPVVFDKLNAYRPQYAEALVRAFAEQGYKFPQSLA
jgi:hypothetical protein